MKYVELPPIARAEVLRRIGAGYPSEIAEGLLRSAQHDPDWKWVQELCLQLLGHKNDDVRRAAITSLGHLARIHSILDLEIVLPRLEVLRSHPTLGGTIEDALDDIRIFVPRQ